MRSENKRMKAYLAANGVKATPKWIAKGSMKHVWRLWDRRPWTKELAQQLNALGFRNWDGGPLGEFSGNGGSFCVFVRGHEEFLS